ncbi:PilN domain-containing protein [Vibrio sp. ER1A]|uniref:PilN domain-containing protein n=1 Tax=Vibrio sp. ER1A TaxID=1517681 RepID=UPI00068E0EC5|nr:PilN domain-containing protein [Vibrio sp. ER1A]
MSVINLLPWREQQRRHHRQRFVILNITAVLGGYFICTLALHHFESEVAIQNQRVVYLQKAITEQRLRMNQLSDVATQYENLLQRLELVQTLQAERGKTTAVMNLIPALIPQGVYIDKIRMRGKRFKLFGISENTALLAEMLERFEQEPTVSYVEIHSIVHGHQRFDKSYQAFELSFQVSLSTLLPPALKIFQSKEVG